LAQVSGGYTKQSDIPNTELAGSSENFDCKDIMANTLVKLQFKVLCWIFAALLLFGFTRGIGDVVNHSDTDHKIAQSHKAQHFWDVVAGNSAGNEPTPGNKLARDIRSLDDATINSFRGNSNAYGGVVEEIGFDPFNESGLNCFECGPLSDSVKHNLVLVHSGQASVVTASLEVPKDASYHVTPLDWSVSRTLLITWMVGGPLSLLGACLWLEEGGLSKILRDADKSTRYALIGLTPVVMGPIAVSQVLKERRFKRQVRQAFPDHMTIIDSVDEALEGLDPSLPETIQIRTERDDVMAELEHQTRQGADHNAIVNRFLLDNLHSVKENLDCRLEAMKELDK
jgi:hypothetical protein